MVETFARSYRLVRTAFKSIPASMLTRAAPECRYIVTDTDNRVVAAGNVPAGRYTASVILAVNGNVMSPDIHRVLIVVGSGR